MAAQSANFVQINIFVSWLGASLLRLRAHRCACLLRGLAHGLMQARPYRRDTKAPGSIPVGGKQVEEATRMSVLAITVRQSPAVRLACYHLDGPGSA
jgi:hypothetical protein